MHLSSILVTHLFYDVFLATSPSGVRASSIFVLAPSTSTTGSNRRGPPPRGFLLATLLGCPLRPQASPRAEGRRQRIRASCGSARPFFSSTCTGSVGRAFPTATVVLYSDRLSFVFVLDYSSSGAAVNWGGWTCFGRVHMSLGSLAEQGPQVHCVRGNGSHLGFYFAYSGGGSSGFDVVSHFGGCGFPTGRAINEIDESQHTDRTTFSIVKGEGQFQGYLRSLGLSITRAHPLGAQSEEIPRPPAGVGV